MAVLDDILMHWRRRFWHADAERLSAFDGRHPVTVITGASEGIGQAIAEICATQGHALLLVARGEARLQLVAETLRRSGAGRVGCLALDVTADDAVARIEAFVAAEGGYIDVLVNNAGVGLGGAFVAQDRAQIDGLMELNMMALTRLMRAVLPDMLVRGRGGVINIASLGGYGPGAYQAAYYASKAYVISLSEAVAYEVRGQGVRVLAVAPGPVETAFHAKMGAEHALYRTVIPPVGARHVARSALRGFRLGFTVVRPGLISFVLMTLVRAVPHPLSVPIIGLLLRPPRRR